MFNERGTRSPCRVKSQCLMRGVQEVHVELNHNLVYSIKQQEAQIESAM